MFHAGFHFIALFAQGGDKLSEGHGGGYGLVHVLPDQAPPGGFAFLLGLPFGIVLGLAALRVVNDGQGVFPA